MQQHMSGCTLIMNLILQNIKLLNNIYLLSQKIIKIKVFFHKLVFEFLNSRFVQVCSNSIQREVDKIYNKRILNKDKLFIVLGRPILAFC